MDSQNFSRRTILRNGALLAAVGAVGSPTLLSEPCNPGGTVRDRLWLWGHYQGSHNEGWNLPGKSRISPVEAACYMGTPNVIMVEYNGKPELPCNQYAIPFRALNQVVWSIVAAGGITNDTERQIVLKMARENPNFIGVTMDDFFPNSAQSQPALSIEDVAQLQKQLKSGNKQLELWVTLYMYQLNGPIQDYLKYCDVLTLWTWKAPELAHLAANFKKVESLAPHKRKVLGCYMWDYGNKRPMPLSAMEDQCEQGLEWLRQGKIEGMIFLASCICDLNLEAVEWTRQWIQKTGGGKLALKRPRSGAQA